MTREEVFAGVVDVLRYTFKQPQLTVSDTTTASDVDGWDSVAHASILVRLEKRFNLRIPPEVAYDAERVGDLVDGIHALVK